MAKLKLNKDLRQRKNMRQEDLAKLLNVDRTTVTKWETGDALPRAEMLFTLAEVFQCKMDDLLCS